MRADGGKAWFDSCDFSAVQWGEPGADFSHTGSTLCSPCQHFIHPRKHKEQAGGHGLRWEERLGACSGAGEVRLGKGV